MRNQRLIFIVLLVLFSSAIVNAADGADVAAFNITSSARNIYSLRSALPTSDSDKKQALIIAERDLRTYGKKLEKENRPLKEKIDKKESLGDNDLVRYNKFIKDMETIKKTIPYNSIDDLLQSFDDYDDYFFKFDIGYQFTSVNKAFSSGNPRVDFMLYHRYRHYQQTAKEHGGMFDIHASLAARLTGSEEAKSDFTDKTGQSTTNDTINLGNKRSLDFDINVFMPLYKTPTIRLDGRDRLYSMIGPLLVYGGKKVDDSKHLDQRLYGGLRFAISPETYSDVLYGKTESLTTQRVEIRGQMPIYRKENGSQVLIGAIANLGVNNRKTSTEEDAVTIYAVWNLDVKDFFGIFK